MFINLTIFIKIGYDINRSKKQRGNGNDINVQNKSRVLRWRGSLEGDKTRRKTIHNRMDKMVCNRIRSS